MHLCPSKPLLWTINFWKGNFHSTDVSLEKIITPLEMLHVYRKVSHFSVFTTLLFVCHNITKINNLQKDFSVFLNLQFSNLNKVVNKMEILKLQILFYFLESIVKFQRKKILTSTF